VKDYTSSDGKELSLCGGLLLSGTVVPASVLDSINSASLPDPVELSDTCLVDLFLTKGISSTSSSSSSSSSPACNLQWPYLLPQYHVIYNSQKINVIKKNATAEFIAAATGGQHAGQKIIYLPFEDTSPKSTPCVLDGPAVGAPASPSCTRRAFSCSAVWIYFMSEAIQAPNFQYKKNKVKVTAPGCSGCKTLVKFLKIVTEKIREHNLKVYLQGQWNCTSKLRIL
jgi:hypothetical protein